MDIDSIVPHSSKRKNNDNGDTESIEKKIKINDNNNYLFIPHPYQIKFFHQLYIDRNNPIDLNTSYIIGYEQPCIGWTELMRNVCIFTDDSFETYVSNLINREEEINKTNALGYSTFLLAARHNLIKKCEILLKYEQNINCLTNTGNNALIVLLNHAEFSDEYNLIKLLINSGINVDHINDSKCNALYYASVRRNSIQITQLLLECMKSPIEIQSLNGRGDNLLRKLLFDPDDFNYDLTKLIFKNTGKAARDYVDIELKYFCEHAFDRIGYEDVTEMDTTVLELLFEMGADITKVMDEILFIYDAEKKNQMISVLFAALNTVKNRYKEQLDENAIMKDCLLGVAFVEKPIVGHIVSYVNSYSSL